MWLAGPKGKAYKRLLGMGWAWGQDTREKVVRKPAEGAGQTYQPLTSVAPTPHNPMCLLFVPEQAGLGFDGTAGSEAGEDSGLRATSVAGLWIFGIALSATFQR